jgi:hypothetical protein
MWVVNAMYRQLYLPVKRPGTHYTGGWLLVWLCSEKYRTTWIQSAASRYSVQHEYFCIYKVELADCHILHKQKLIFVSHVLRVLPVCEVMVLGWKIWHRGNL